MSESSEESIDQKYGSKQPLVLKLHSLDSSNSSQNDDIIFSSHFLSCKYDYGSKTSVTTRSNNKNIFNSEDILIQKKNLFGSTSSSPDKIPKRKSNDNLPTEPGLIKVKNYNSPTKKYSVFKLIEKDKKNKREFKSHLIDLKKEKEEETPRKKERYDIYGNIINKKNKKKIKVSFIDTVTHQPLANIIDIESFRKYNYTPDIPKEEKINNVSANCQCCFIF